MTAAKTIRDFFQDNKEDLVRASDLAGKIREMIRVIDPFIQQHTSVVCPGCRKVCCINKHAYYETDDLIYLYALGLNPHGYEQRGDDEPCQFLSAEGCKLDRTVRPSGCNWYVCDELLDSFETSSGRAYADFDGSLQELADLWMEMVSEFKMKFSEIKGSGNG